MKKKWILATAPLLLFFCAFGCQKDSLASSDPWGHTLSFFSLLLLVLGLWNLIWPRSYCSLLNKLFRREESWNESLVWARVRGGCAVFVALLNLLS